MEPGLANAYAGRGQALQKEGARDQAVCDYRQALILNRDVPVAAAGLARLGAKP
jgi:Flp pilus assembly protein TadD